VICIKPFLKKHPYGPGLFFLNSAIGFFIICFPIAAVLALLLVTVLEAFVAYCLMGLYFKIYLKFRIVLAWFVAANVVSTVVGVMFLVVAGDHPFIANNGDFGLLVAFFLCFVLSVVIESVVILGLMPGKLDCLRKYIISIGYKKLRNGTDSIGFEVAVGILFANMVSYFMFLMIPVVYEILKLFST
jgi:hypothetical protein